MVFEARVVGVGEVYWNCRDGACAWIALLVMYDIEEYRLPGKWWFMGFLILF